MEVAHALAPRTRVEPERYKEIVRLTSEEVMTVAFFIPLPNSCHVLPFQLMEVEILTTQS